jgi:hypothetical protein
MATQSKLAGHQLRTSGIGPYSELLYQICQRVGIVQHDTSVMKQPLFQTFRESYLGHLGINWRMLLFMLMGRDYVSELWYISCSLFNDAFSVTQDFIVSNEGETAE